MGIQFVEGIQQLKPIDCQTQSILLQEELLKVIPDGAVQGTRWEGQPYHVTLGAVSWQTTAQEILVAPSNYSIC